MARRVEDLPAENRAAFASSEQRSFFLGEDWFSNFVHEIPGAAERAWYFHVPADPASDCPAAVLPTWQPKAHIPPHRARHLHALRNFYSSDFGLVTEGIDGNLGHCAERLVGLLAGVGSAWDVVNLGPFDHEGVDHQALRAAFRGLGWATQDYFCFVNWYLPCAGMSFDDYWAGRPSRVRNTADRRRRRFFRQSGARVQILTEVCELEEALFAYETVYARSWKPTEPHREFVSGVARMAARRGRLRMGIGWVGDRPVAAQLWVVAHGTAYIYKLAYDTEYAHLSPGTLLTVELFRYALDRDRVHTVDYLTGDDAYKRDWMTHSRERWGLLAFNPHTVRGRLSAARHIGGHKVKRSMAWLRLPVADSRDRRRQVPTGVPSRPAGANRPPAVVLGLCVHGLASARALAGAGVPVHVLETNPDLPGTRTRCAQVHYVRDINGPALIDALVGFAQKLNAGQKLQLVPINDNMVRTVALNWAQLDSHYRLSWSRQADKVLNLVDKMSLEEHCRERGLLYPATHYLREPGDAACYADLRFPVIVKPARPLSRFKVKLVRSHQELCEVATTFESEMPLLVQDWVPGLDDRLHFCHAYLHEGKVLARFEGRKRRSKPAALGQATVAAPFPNDEVYELTVRFFEGLNLSGAVAVEFKQDSDGRYWVIEPTVGRTEFLVGLTIENGINLPLLEYHHTEPLPPSMSPTRSRAVWYDTERDPLAFLAMLRDEPALMTQTRSAFPFLSWRDPGPFLASATIAASLAANALQRRAERWLKQ